jgi:nitrogen fixation NifU-like protein
VAAFGYYSDKVIEHFQNPRNVGEIKDADGVGVAGSQACGDMIQITIKVCDSRIEDVKFKTFGCGAAIAISSIATELIKGETIEDALQVSNQDVVEALAGLPPVKMHCSLLAEQAIKAAIKDYEAKNQHPKSKAQDVQEGDDGGDGRSVAETD